jgi:hypothetical protein
MLMSLILGNYETITILMSYSNKQALSKDLLEASENSDDSR